MRLWFRFLMAQMISYFVFAGVSIVSGNPHSPNESLAGLIIALAVTYITNENEKIKNDTVQASSGQRR